jgi:tetratricopeptide (TPR) repeat protein
MHHRIFANLANVHWTLANTSCGLSPLANVRLLSVGESLIGEIREPHNNIASVYDNMGENSKALSYFERALDILQRSLPHNHPDLENVKVGIEIVKKKL